MSSLSKSASSSSEGDAELRRGPWTLEEDSLLNHYIACHGEGRWNLLAKRSGLRRTGKSCRLRWLNYLKPDVKHGNLSTQEQLLIIYLHSKWGSSWSKIARHLPGRTDNEIKNYWRTRVQKRAHHLKIDANSAAFQEVLRCFRIPRLQQTIETPSLSSSSPLAISSQDSTANPQPFDHTDRELPLTLPPGDEMINFLDHHEESSSTEVCTTPSICSSESMNTNTTMTQFPQVSEYPHPPSPSADTIYSHVNIAPIDFYYNYTTSYDMERPSLSFAAMSASADFQNPVGDRHVDESNWVDNDLADSLWNMDELWQFRKL